MQKTDLIGYVALIGTLAASLKDLFLTSQPQTPLGWVITILSAVALIAWAFYDELTGTKPVQK